MRYDTVRYDRESEKLKIINLIYRREPKQNKNWAVAEMGDRARAKRAENGGRGCCVSSPRSMGEELDPQYLTQCRLGRGLPLYQVAS